MIKHQSETEEAKRAAADYVRQLQPIDQAMGWRLDDVVAAFIAGAAWLPLATATRRRN